MSFARDPILIVGLFLTFGVGALTYARSTDADIAFLSALVVATMMLVVDLLYRFEQERAAAQRSDALLTQIRRSSTFGSFVERCAQHLSDTRALDEEVFDEAAERCLVDAEARLRELADGRLVSRYRESDLATYAVEQADERFSAVMHLDVDQDWWSESLEARYLEANYQAAASGIAVERVIIYSPAAMQRWSQQIRTSRSSAHTASTSGSSPIPP